MRGLGAILAVAVLTLLGGVGVAGAQYPREPESEIDPNLFRIDEKSALGVKLDADLPLVDQEGRGFRLGDLLGKPLVVVLAYYRCDGTCSVVNRDLKNVLADVRRMEMGRDYRVLTITFDKNDNQETLAKFRQGLELPDKWLKEWTFALPGDQGALRRMTDSIGYKYFWSPRDKTFFHPGVYVVLSGEGRASRFLYSTATSARDLELALIDAQAGQIAEPRDIINFAVSLCYSYNYKEGRYTINIPLFVGLGALVFGVLALVVSVVGYRWYKRKERTA
ncbi:MAG: SCO family protein [Alphaproteobacteria bacterium]|nr:SCO family protein [Alphaproteobacteria bacterium]MBF0128791.1 SCO family protein [Alphaproteobacteria bacterium]